MEQRKPSKAVKKKHGVSRLDKEAAAKRALKEAYSSAPMALDMVKQDPIAVYGHMTGAGNEMSNTGQGSSKEGTRLDPAYKL